MDFIHKNNNSTKIIPSTHIQTDSDSIDLILLLDILWQHQKKIWYTTGVFILLGLMVALFMPQRWSSQAVITSPENRQLAHLQTALIDLEILGVSVPTSADELYLKFLKRFDSQNLLQTYLRSSDYIKDRLNGNFADADLVHREVISAADDFKMNSNEDPSNKVKNAYQSWTLKFTAATAIQAQDVLGGYIRFVCNQVKMDTLDDIRTAVSLHIEREENQLKLDISNLSNAHQNKLKRLQYSLAIANAAGIKNPVYSNGQAVKDDQDYSVSLGANGIQQKIEIERELMDVTKMNTDIQNRQHRLEQLKKINVNDIDFSAFNYQQAPSLPVKNDGPRKALIVILATLLGVLLSCGTILLRHTLSEYKQARSV